MRIAINGFGRIGRNFLRGIITDKQAEKKIEIVAINLGPASPDYIGHLFKYDTLMGTFAGTAMSDYTSLTINNKKYQLLAEPIASKLPWSKLNIDWVVDCSGKYTERVKAEEHIKAGAKAILISAPAKDEDVSIVPGVNDAMFDKNKHKIVSLGSCTTNALMPMLKVLYESCGFEQGFMNTMHAYTNSQALLDLEGKDPRMARAAALNIVPTSTGASKMIGKIIPALAGKLHAESIRVPVGKVSILSITFTSSQTLKKESINAAFERAAQGSLKGILDISYQPCVSSDYAGSSQSVIVDGIMTSSLGSMACVFGWYDNEWAYSLRLKDFLMGNLAEI